MSHITGLMGVIVVGVRVTMAYDMDMVTIFFIVSVARVIGSKIQKKLGVRMFRRLLKYQFMVLPFYSKRFEQSKTLVQ